MKTHVWELRYKNIRRIVIQKGPRFVCSEMKLEDGRLKVSCFIIHKNRVRDIF
jgi:hypothetical protein